MAVKHPRKPKAQDRPQGDQRPKERGKRARRRQEREMERSTLGDEVTREGDVRYEGPDTRHGPQPPIRGLQADEPLWTDPSRKDKKARARRDNREGVMREGAFRHVKKDRAMSHEPEDEG